jgi:tetratricopeptide (TPR) repeat protein
VILSTLHGLKSFQRNYDWQSNFHVYSSGVKVNPTNGVLLTNLGIEYADRQNFSYAEVLYRRAIEVCPDHSKGYGNLGGLLEALGEDEEAESSLMKAISFGTSDDTLSKLLETYEFLVKTVLMKNESKLPKALAVLDDALQTYPTVVTLRTLRANVLTRMDRVSEAFEELKIASNARTVVPTVHFNYGLAYSHQGDVKRAEESFRNAIRLRRGYYEAIMELGRLYYWNGGTAKADAENMLREAFNELPKSFLAPFYLGEVFLDQKQYAQAKRLLHKANTRSNWTYRHVLYALGRLHMEVKDYRAAVDVFERIVKLDAHYKDVRTLLKKAKKQTAN